MKSKVLSECMLLIIFLLELSELVNNYPTLKELLLLFLLKLLYYVLKEL